MHGQGFAEFTQFTGFVMQGGVGASGHHREIVHGIVALILVGMMANHARTSGDDGHMLIGFAITHGDSCSL
jgi:hypothetical protein